jgi:hypothetical protein
MHVQKILDAVKLSQFFVIAPDDAAAMAKVNEADPLAPDAPSDAAKRPRGKKRSLNPTESCDGRARGVPIPFCRAGATS